MKKSFVTLLMTALFAISLSAADAEAARYRTSSQFRTASSGVARSACKRCVRQYPKAVRKNGRTLWDLGKQNGQWPAF